MSAPELRASSWRPIDLGPIVAGIQAGGIVGPTPTRMARTDGARLLYGGEVHSLAGEPESGKGWIMLGAVSTSVTYGDCVLYVDFEDTAASAIGRLLALGTPPEAILERFVYVRPCDPFTPEVLTDLLDARDYDLAVLDGLSEAYALLGLDPHVDAAKFLAALPRRIAERGAAVVEIDHVVKSKESRGRWPIGGQHKLAGIGAAFSTEVIKQPSRTDAGLVKIKVEKDRHGHVRSHAQGGVIALAHITPTEDGERVSVTLEPPDASTSEDGTFRPTVLMGRVARYVEDEPGASLNAIRRGVKGKDTHIGEALRLLIAEGYVERRKEGQANHHYTRSPFDENAGPPTTAQPRSNHGPAAGAANHGPRPTPLGGATVRGQHNGHDDLQDRVRAISAMGTEQEQAEAWQRLEAEVG